MVQLHVHSEFSFQDSLVRITELVSYAQMLDHPAVTLTDHGYLCGVLDFYLQSKDEGIKPIIGVEAYVVKDLSVKEKGDKRFHMVLLAIDYEGYKNLLRLGSIAGTDGFYYVPRMDLKTISEYSEGLIALTACHYSSILYIEDDVHMTAEELRVIFPERLYLEIMPHDNALQKKHNLLLYEMADTLEIPLVFSQDVHYLRAESREAHDILMIQQGRDPYSDDTYFFGSEKDVKELFESHQVLPERAIKQAIENSDLIAEQITQYEIPVGSFEYPQYTVV